MENYQSSKQELETLLAQLRKLHEKYPPDLLAARRRLYLAMVAQVAATRIAADIKRKHWISSVMQEPSSIIIKVLIAIFAAFLIAFIAHTIASGGLEFERIMGLISP